MKEHLLAEIAKMKKELHFFKMALMSLKGMEQRGTLDRNTKLAKLVVDGSTIKVAATICDVNKSKAKHIVAAICKQRNPRLYAAGVHEFSHEAPLIFLRNNASGFFSR